MSASHAAMGDTPSFVGVEPAVPLLRAYEEHCEEPTRRRKGDASHAQPQDPNFALCVDTWSNKFRYGVTKKNIKYNKIESRFDFNVQQYKKRVHKFKTDSSSFFKKINKNLLFDLIYIDGSHKYKDVLNDARNGFDHLKNSGIIIFDDFNKPEVQKAILFFLNKNSKKIKVLMFYHQLIVKKI